MDHRLEIISPRLEILEIEVCNIIYNPGNIGNWIFLIFSYPGNTGNLVFLISHILETLEIEVCNILHNLEMRAAGGRLQGLCCAALDYFWNMFPGISGYPGNTGNMIFIYFCDFSKKDARRNFTQDAPTDEPRSLI